MIIYALLALALAAGWQLLIWRLHRVVRQRIDMAVVATSQRLTSRLFASQQRLTTEQQRTALAHALASTSELLGPWNRLLLRISLLRWDLTGWLTLALENRVYRLKFTGRLPISQPAMMVRDPEKKLIADAATELGKLYLAHIQRPAPTPPSQA